MGDGRKQALFVQSDGKLRLEFHGAKITSDAGLLAFRELDEAFRLTEKGSTVWSDCRRGKNTRHSLLRMLRQSVRGRLAGYEDVNDGDTLDNVVPKAGTGERPSRRLRRKLRWARNTVRKAVFT